MAIHDWSRVDPGIFHHFHHAWIEEIARFLNRGVLPSDYYAMAEQHTSHFGPDVLTLQSKPSAATDSGDHEPSGYHPSSNGGGVIVSRPRMRSPAKPIWRSIVVSRMSSPCDTSAATGSWPSLR